jgi:hypothetical protein
LSSQGGKAGLPSAATADRFFGLQQSWIELYSSTAGYGTLQKQKKQTMKIVIPGSLGDISKPLTINLVHSGRAAKNHYLTRPELRKVKLRDLANEFAAGMSSTKQRSYGL